MNLTKIEITEIEDKVKQIKQWATLKTEEYKRFNNEASSMIFQTCLCLDCEHFKCSIEQETVSPKRTIVYDGKCMLTGEYSLTVKSHVRNCASYKSISKRLSVLKDIKDFDY